MSRLLAASVLAVTGCDSGISTPSSENNYTITEPLTAAGLTSRAVTARASAGAITLAFAASPTTVDAQTKVGSVTVQLPADMAYAVASSQVGDVEVTVRRDSGSPHCVTARSQVGSVTVNKQLITPVRDQVAANSRNGLIGMSAHPP